jgi:hypothetical protein
MLSNGFRQGISFPTLPISQWKSLQMKSLSPSKDFSTD